MRYLIQIKGDNPFYTEWFNIENHYVKGMIVYDLYLSKYLDNEFAQWKDIKCDQL